MRTIDDLIATREGQSAVIVCPGATVKERKDVINNFIDESNSFVIGLNNVVSIRIPDYHFWTNTQRFKTYGKNINFNSTVLIGSYLSKKLVREILGLNEYVLVNYIEKKNGFFDETIPMDYREGKIHGFYRTSGCLSIMIAHLMGASDISIVGMDTYAMMHTKEDLVAGKQNHHCYSKGFTATATWETCIDIDRKTNKVLHNLKEYGIDFNIITPTGHKDFYKGGVL